MVRSFARRAMPAPALDHDVRSDQQMAADFLSYLQSESADPVAYEVEPTQLSGGADARLYRYKLVGQQPRVLRILRPNREVEELRYYQFVHQTLKRHGLKVPAIHSVCGDQSFLGGVFAVMDLVSGRPLCEQDPDLHGKVLGESMAHMHELDVRPVIDAFRESGIPKDAFLSPALLEQWLDGAAKNFPWTFELVGWLRNHLPLAERELSVIHGDYHGGNLMFENGSVTGVLDWGFFVADSALDLANMMNGYLIWAPQCSKDVPPDFWQRIVDGALKSYRIIRSVNYEYIKAFRVLHLLGPLCRASFYPEFMRKPESQREYLAFIEQTTGLKLSPAG